MTETLSSFTPSSFTNKFLIAFDTAYTPVAIFVRPWKKVTKNFS